MRIGELAKSVQLGANAIRFYERVGLLPEPERTASNYRTCSQFHVERLAFIRRCRGLDMSLAEIRALLQFCADPQRQCDAVNDMLDDHVAQVESRIVELQRLARELNRMRTLCRVSGKAKNCQVLKTLRVA
ncbi:MAG: Cd(II)/Pb(II)-responsive transcriptional regulator [Betaproteobacteria bacterium]|jgi:Cd(II)/Pb(II)-responsive transcriptional regulator|nr:MAG: Cd(II)/Pb(II)-responsive transcriptional regulator [Betaproteobacteria bacterium]